MASDKDFIDRLGSVWERWAQVPKERMRRLLKIHIGVFAAAVILFMFVWKPFPQESAAYFWLPFLWGVIAATHYFIVSSFLVTESWVRERSQDLQVKGYDFGHIEDIREREKSSDDSVISPMDPRRKTPPTGPGKKGKD